MYCYVYVFLLLCMFRSGYSVSLCRSVYYFVLWPTNAQLFHKLSHSYMFGHYRVILRELVTNTLPSYTSISNAGVGNTICTLTNKCTIISQIITLLHVSTLSCHPQEVCNQYLCQVTQVFQMQLLVIQFVLWPTNAQLFHKLSYCYMFGHYRVNPIAVNKFIIYQCFWGWDTFRAKKLQRKNIDMFICVWLPWLRFFRAFSSDIRQMPM